MRIFKGLNSVPHEITDAILALGNFDGVHIGHKEIIKAALASKGTTDALVGVVTFFPHPVAVLRKGVAFKYILTLEERLAKLADLGVNFAVVIDFTKEFASTSADEFIQSVLINKLKANKVLTGSNFYFGAKRTGDANLLARYAAEGHFSYQMIDKINYNYMDVSSSMIKELMGTARMERVNLLLGAPYYITGKVVKGAGVATATLQTPTANLHINQEKALPYHGVYFVRVVLGKESFPGIANLGVKPTVGGEAVTLEAHLFDFNEDIYGRELKVEFLSFIRPEYKFESLESLKTQIKIDIRNCRYLARDIKKISG